MPDGNHELRSGEDVDLSVIILATSDVAATSCGNVSSMVITNCPTA